MQIFHISFAWWLVNDHWCVCVGVQRMSLINLFLLLQNVFAQLAGDVEYTDCISAEE